MLYNFKKNLVPMLRNSRYLSGKTWNSHWLSISKRCGEEMQITANSLNEWEGEREEYTRVRL
jgi:hypothetical protein